jgi:hypothetical protein
MSKVLDDILQKRQRAKVAERFDEGLSAPSDDNNFAAAAETLIEPKTKLLATQQPEFTREEEPLNLKKLTFRVEVEIALGLQQLALEQPITPETFLEGLYELCQSDPSLMGKALTLAKERYKRRKIRGVRKRAQNMLKNLDD